jgi:hypothetical protein
MPGLVPGIHVLLAGVFKDVDGRDNRAFTPVFDGLCPAMTEKVQLASASSESWRGE